MFAALLGMIGLTLSSFVFIDPDEDEEAPDQAQLNETNDTNESLLSEAATTVANDDPLAELDINSDVSGLSGAGQNAGTFEVVSERGTLPTSELIEVEPEAIAEDLAEITPEEKAGIIDVSTLPLNVMTGSASSEDLYGSDGDDEIHGGEGDDRIYGRLGSNTLFGEAGDDTLIGSEGTDVLDGGEGDDTLMGGWGDDVLRGGAGEDMLQGGGGNDVLDGSDDDDTDFLNGGDGDDLIIAGNQDVINSGEGADRIVTDTDNALEIDDFDAAQDTLEVVYEGDLPALTTSSENGALRLMADDTLVATLYGVETFDVNQVRLIQIAA